MTLNAELFLWTNPVNFSWSFQKRSWLSVHYSKNALWTFYPWRIRRIRYFPSSWHVVVILEKIFHESLSVTRVSQKWRLSDLNFNLGSTTISSPDTSLSLSLSFQIYIKNFLLIFLLDFLKFLSKFKNKNYYKYLYI